MKRLNSKPMERTCSLFKKNIIIFFSLALLLSPFSIALSSSNQVFAEGTTETEEDVDVSEEGSDDGSENESSEEESAADTSVDDESGEMETGEGEEENLTNENMEEESNPEDEPEEADTESSEVKESEEALEEVSEEIDADEVEDNNDMNVMVLKNMQLLADEDDFEVTDNGDNTVSVNKYNGTDTDIIIPEKIGGKPVTKIGLAAFQNKGLTGVVIPNSVTVIDVNAFKENKLTSIDIPNSVTTIALDAFSYNNLSTVVIPDSVISISNSAFSSNQLTSITIGEKVSSIGSSAFAYNSSIDTIIVSAANMNFKDVNNKGLYTKDGTKLVRGTRSGEIAQGTKVIGQRALSGVGLTGKIVIPAGVTRIEGLAFEGNNLTEVDIPIGVTHIGATAFNSNNLSSIVIPEGVTEIQQYAFSRNELKSIVLPNSLKEIDRGAFGDNKNVEELIVKNKDMEIPTIHQPSDSPFDDLKDAIIWGHEGSTIQEFAMENNYTFNPKGKVITKHVDKSGDSLSPDTVMEEMLRDPENDFERNTYETSPTDINGYVLMDTIGEETGPYTLEDQIVKYVYEKEAEVLEIARHYHHGYTPLKTGIYDQSALPLPKKVKATLTGGKEVELEVVWRADSEPVYNKDEEGQYRFTGDFKLTDGIVNPHGYVATYDFGLTHPDPDPDKEIDSVPIAGSTFGLGEKDLAGILAFLPETVEVTLDDGTSQKIKVKWNEVSDPAYDENKVGAYMFSGTFILPEGIANTEGLIPTHQINVYDSDEEEPVDPVDPEDPEDPEDPSPNPDQDKEIDSVPIAGSTFGLGEKDLAGILAFLPETVEVTLDDGTSEKVKVKWNELSAPHFDGDKVGKYMFGGEFILTEGIANTAGHIMVYQINVFDFDAIDSEEPEESQDPEDDEKTSTEEINDGKKEDEKDSIIITVEKSDGDTTEKQKAGPKMLPKTATPYYTILLTGLFLMLFGGVTYFIVRKKRME